RGVGPALAAVGAVGGGGGLAVERALELLAAAHVRLALLVRAPHGDGARRDGERPDAARHALADDLRDARRLHGGLARGRPARVPEVPQRLIALILTVGEIAADVLVVLAERVAVVGKRQRHAAGDG